MAEYNEKEVIGLKHNKRYLEKHNNTKMTIGEYIDLYIFGRKYLDYMINGNFNYLERQSYDRPTKDNLETIIKTLKDILKNKDFKKHNYIADDKDYVVFKNFNIPYKKIKRVLSYSDMFLMSDLLNDEAHYLDSLGENMPNKDYELFLNKVNEYDNFKSNHFRYREELVIGGKSYYVTRNMFGNGLYLIEMSFQIHVLDKDGNYKLIKPNKNNKTLINNIRRDYDISNNHVIYKAMEGLLQFIINLQEMLDREGEL